MSRPGRRESLHADALSYMAVADAHRLAGRREESRVALDAALMAAVDAMELVPDEFRDDAERAFIAALVKRWAAFGSVSFSDSIAAVERALPIIAGALDKATTGAVTQAIALARTLRGEGSTAEMLAAAEANVVAAAGDPVASAEAEAYLASHLEWLGSVALAREHLATARSHIESVSDVVRDTVEETDRFVRQIEAHITFAEGRHLDAAAAFEELATDYGDRGVAFLATAASAYVAAGSVGRARAVLERIEGLPSELWAADILGIEGELLLEEGRYREACLTFDEALVALGSTPHSDLRWRLLHGRGRARAGIGDAAAALDEYVAAAEEALRTRRAPLGYELDSHSIAEKRPLFDEAIALAADVAAAETCVNLMEKIKAAALSAMLSIPSSVRAADDEITALGDAADAIELALKHAGPANAATFMARREELLERRQAAIDRYRRDDPRWALLTIPPPFDARLLKRALRTRRQAVISIHVTESEIVSVVVDGDGFASGRMTHGAMKRIEHYVANLTAAHPTSAAFDPTRLKIDVADIVPDSLLDRALGSDTVVVVPHAVLHLLPWPALQFRGRRLFELRPIGVLPNLTCVQLLESPVTPSIGATLIGTGRDLPGVLAEIGDIAAVYEGRVTVLEGEDVVQGRVLRELASSEDAVLHLACHGRADTQWPMSSGLEASDRLVDASDIVIGGVGRREVVLSACSTGWRPYKVRDTQLLADDVLGLPGALLEGGASSLLVSIPPAEDQPMRRLCVAYHRARRAGDSPLFALARAQRERSDAGDPAWGWAGSVLYSCW